MINILINGCNGKMGQVLAETAARDPEIEVTAGIDKFPDARENPFPVYASLEECDKKADVVIDFSVPAALPDLLHQAQGRKMPVIIATTGLSEEDLDLIRAASRSIPVFRAANMSLGVNLMYELIQKAASVLGNSFDIEIIEKHHNQKIDAPSGTAYALADAINEVFLGSKDYIYGRYSKTDKRANNEIGIHAVRGGTLVGEHDVLFAGTDEVLQVSHSAHSKQIFAAGALRAAKFILHKPPGLYNMKDIMTEHSSVTNIYTSNEEAMITIHNLPDDTKVIARLFSAMADANINIDMISQTAPENNEVSVSFTLPDQDLPQAIQLIDNLRSDISRLRTDVFDDITKLSVEGVGMERQSGVAARIFEVMAKQDIRIKTITTSETKISYVIDQTVEKRAVEAIIQTFGL